MKFKQRHTVVKKLLEEVSPSFCLAKWKQVTIHLQNGQTHSCHHPGTHKIPLDELKDNPSALHNTHFKKMKRREMLAGSKPNECDYCWKVESSSDSFSDRILKSSEEWSLPHYEKIKNSPWDWDVNPSYVEVSFSNACNQKCAYCFPHISSKWMEEIQKYGPYSTIPMFNSIERLKSRDMMPIPHREENPYVEAFWKWWPDLYRDLHTFRITGGEPLLSKDTFRVMDYIINEENPNIDLNFSVNTNLMVEDFLIDDFIEKINKMAYKTKSLTIYTSIDTWGKQAEYIRYPMNFDKFWDNCHKVLSKCWASKLHFMCTFNILSLPKFGKLLLEIEKLKKQYGDEKVIFVTEFLRYPGHMSIKLLSEEWISVFENYIKSTSKFTDYEIEKLNRIVDYMKASSDESWKEKMKKNFVIYFTEYDRRRKTNFKEVFPELIDFWEHCERI
jgi:organic radical activating enzyme